MDKVGSKYMDSGLQIMDHFMVIFVVTSNSSPQRWVIYTYLNLWEVSVVAVHDIYIYV